jgi:hypothetical protein
LSSTLDDEKTDYFAVMIWERISKVLPVPGNWYRLLKIWVKWFSPPTRIDA